MKKILTMLLGASLVFSMAACSDKEDVKDPSGDVTTPESGDTTTPEGGDTTTPEDEDTTTPQTGEKLISVADGGKDPFFKTIDLNGDYLFDFETVGTADKLMETLNLTSLEDVNKQVEYEYKLIDKATKTVIQTINKPIGNWEVCLPTGTEFTDAVNAYVEANVTPGDSLEVSGTVQIVVKSGATMDLIDGDVFTIATTLSFEKVDLTAPFTIPTPVGLVTHNMNNGYLVDFNWSILNNSLKERYDLEDITTSIVIEYTLIDKDNDGVEIGVIQNAWQDNYLYLLTNVQAKEALDEYLDTISQFNINFEIQMQVKVGANSTIETEITDSEVVTSQTISYSKPDPNADIVIPDIVGVVSHQIDAHDFNIDFSWSNHVNALLTLASSEDLKASIVYEYRLFDTDNNQDIATINYAFGESYIDILLRNADAKDAVYNYAKENNLENVNFDIYITVKASDAPTLTVGITASSTEQVEGFTYKKPAEVTGSAFEFNEFFETSTGEAVLTPGQMSGWWHQSEGDGNTGVLGTSYSDGVVNLIGFQDVAGGFWQTQFFAKFNAVTETGRYTETLIINSDVAGVIRINGSDYELEVGDNTIVLTFDLNEGQNASLSIQFGTPTGGDKTIGNFKMTISGFTQK